MQIIKKIVFTHENNSSMPVSYICLKESFEDLKPTEITSDIKIDSDGIEGNENFKGEIIIDLDKDGKIVGIEILGDVIPDILKKE